MARVLTERIDLLGDDEVECRVCGCTDDFACDGGCVWVPDPLNQGDLCSNCLPRVLADAGVGPGEDVSA